MTWPDTEVCRLTIALVGALVVGAGASQCAMAQTSISDLLGRPTTPEGQPKTFLDETMLYGYVENSYVVNLGRAGRGGVNELRFYDVDEGYTFNAFELSLKKDPSEAHRFGFGAVLTAGRDSQKNHSLGIFRDRDDPPPYYRNTPEVDVVEAYAAYLVPIGNGLTLKPRPRWRGGAASYRLGGHPAPRGRRDPRPGAPVGDRRPSGRCGGGAGRAGAGDRRAGSGPPAPRARGGAWAGRWPDLPASRAGAR